MQSKINNNNNRKSYTLQNGAELDYENIRTQDYYKKHMADGTFVSWLALDNDKIIGTSGMSFVEKPPYFGCPCGKVGLLSRGIVIYGFWICKK